MASETKHAVSTAAPSGNAIMRFATISVLPVPSLQF
jgi:hypothetical protein